MPRRRAPQQLRTICKWEILKNLPKYSTKELEELPDNLSAELIDLYNKEFMQNECEDETEYYFRFTYRNRLIKPNVKKLNLLFSNCKLCSHTTVILLLPDEYNLFRESLMVVLERCNRLTHFSCDFTKQPRNYLHQLAFSMPNIIELKLHIGEPGENDLDCDDDKFLEAIGNNCFQLEILHLTYSRITDEGVLRFCQSNSAGAKIKELNLESSRVTFNGCLTALRNLKQLRRFYCQRDNRLIQLVEAFKKLFEDSKNSPVPTFQLCQFWEYLYIDGISTGFLSFLTACCPNVNHLYLVAETNFDRHVEDLKNCNENLSLNLYIHYVDMANLGDVGCRVTELCLCWCKIHLPTIGLTCLNLTKLSLWGVEYMPVNYVDKYNFVDGYSQLLGLGLNSKDSLPIPNEQLLFLLKNCLELQTLKIEYNDEFTDDVMFATLHGVNLLRHLTHFKLECCNAVTVAPIFDLLGRENDLESLVISNCQNLPFLQIDSFIKENNFCVALHEFGHESDDKWEDVSDDN